MISKRFYVSPLTEVIVPLTEGVMRKNSWTPDAGYTTMPIETAETGDEFPSLDELYGAGNTSGGSGKVSGGSAKETLFGTLWDY